MSVIAAALLVTECAGRVPTAPDLAQGPATAVDDDFDRSVLGQNWIVYNGAVGIVNSRAIGVLGVSGDSLGLGIVAWNASSFSADQFSEGVISADGDPRAASQVFVRRRTSDRQRYGFHWSPFAGRWELKRDGGVNAPVLAAAMGPPVAPGDRIRIEARGTAIRGYRNGVLILTAEDSVLAEAGQLGMVLNVAQIMRFPAAFFDSWSGGSLDR